MTNRNTRTIFKKLSLTFKGQNSNYYLPPSRRVIHDEKLVICSYSPARVQITRGNDEYSTCELRHTDIVFSSRECRTHVSSQFILVWNVSPHNPSLISREKQTASSLGNWAHNCKMAYSSYFVWIIWIIFEIRVSVILLEQIVSLSKALGQWGRSKKRAGDKRAPSPFSFLDPPHRPPAVSIVTGREPGTG